MRYSMPILQLTWTQHLTYPSCDIVRPQLAPCWRLASANCDLLKRSIIAPAPSMACATDARHSARSIRRETAGRINSRSSPPREIACASESQRADRPSTVLSLYGDLVGSLASLCHPCAALEAPVWVLLQPVARST